MQVSNRLGISQYYVLGFPEYEPDLNSNHLIVLLAMC